MSTRNISLSVFFPAYNEEENIEKTVRETNAVLSQLTNDYEIIVVNDGSKDRTGEIADALARENSRVKVVHHNPNQGYGAAVWSGVLAATKEYVFFTDADLQFDIKEIELLINEADKHDVVLGYRAKRMDPFMRLLNAKGWNILNRILFGLKVRDIDCAFKLFRRDLVKDIPVQSRGAMLSAELLIRLQRRGVTFKEIPVTHLPRVAGSPTGAKPAVIIRAFKEMFKVYQGELGDARMLTLGRFLLLGAINTIVDWMWYFALTRSFSLFAEHLVYAKGVAFLIGSIPVFLGSTYWVFPKASTVRVLDQVKVYTILASAFFINAFALEAFLSRGANEGIAIFLATVVSFIWNLSIAWFFLIKDSVRVTNAVYERA